jgi:hypothetical protein
MWAMLRHKLVIGAVFLVGCMVGGAASQFVAPAAVAQGLPRFEHYCFDEDPNLPDVTLGKLNAAGAEGWELASQSSYGGSRRTLFCLKRARP